MGLQGGFHGSCYHTLDAKGRVSLPKKFRTTIGDRVWVTRGYDPCAWALSTPAWEALLAKINQLPQSDHAARLVTRHIVGNAQECEIDKLGRILVPATVRSYANIDKEVVVVGMIESIEIWDRESYEKQQSALNQELAESLKDLRI